MDKDIPNVRPYRGGPDPQATVLACGDDRYQIGFVAAGEQARQAYGGPLVPGPWAYAFGLGFAITADGNPGQQSAAPVPIHDGAQIRVCGHVYRVRLTRRNIRLEPV